MAKSSYDALGVAHSAATSAAYNLETIVLLLDGQDEIKVSGHSLAALLRPVVTEIFAAQEELTVTVNAAEGGR